MDTRLYWFWILLKFSGKYFGFKPTINPGRLRTQALGSLGLFCYACSGVSQDVWRFPHRIRGSLFQLSSLQDFLSPPHRSLAHKKLFLGLLARMLDFSEFQLLMFSTVVQLQGWGRLGEKPYKRGKNWGISSYMLLFQVQTLLYNLPASVYFSEFLSTCFCIRSRGF